MADKSIKEPKAKREQWGSSLGFILATAGSAIGLGNIMKFPWMTVQLSWLRTSLSWSLLVHSC